MIRQLLTPTSVIAFALLMSSCGKPNTPPQPPPPTTQNKCFLTFEKVDGGPGYPGSWVYSYDADGHLIKGGNPTVNGQTGDGQLAVNGNIIGIGFSKLLWVYSYAGDLKGGTPSSGYLDFTDDGVANPKFEQYIFGYDGKKRMTSATIANSGTINIRYNDNDDVTQMIFIPTNGPRVISPTVTIEGYDDKPTPYAADPKIWIFTQHMRHWSYFSEYRIISALSKHNPGKITTVYADDPTSTTVDTIYYQYNDKNMPTLANVQRTFRGTKTSYQSNQYSYDCK